MKGNKNESRKGFTLIELLVVIAIIAILSVVVILTLNPAELLRQSRDSNRISDLSVTKSAIAFYLASVTVPSITATSSRCYVGDTVATTTCVTWFATDTDTPKVQSSTSRAVDGTGWLKINFNSVTAGGSPLSNLPMDPLYGNGDAVHFYSYIASSTGLVFKLDAHMESAKYNASGTSDVVSTDGGSDNVSYEAGSNLAL